MIDVSLRLGILRVLRDLRDHLGVSVLLITHDVATARYLGQGSDLYVLYRGQVVEQGRTETVIRRPVHPYTQCLLSATPVLRGVEDPGPERMAPSAPPGNVEPPGCLFEPRCPFAAPDCRSQRPSLGHLGETGQQHACLHPKRRSVVASPLDPRRPCDSVKSRNVLHWRPAGPRQIPANRYGGAGQRAVPCYAPGEPRTCGPEA